MRQLLPAFIQFSDKRAFPGPLTCTYDQFFGIVFVAFSLSMIFSSLKGEVHTGKMSRTIAVFAAV